MRNENLNYSSNYGEAVAQKVNVLASCYIVDSAASLKGLHYCTTGVAGISRPFKFDFYARWLTLLLGAEWYS